MSALKKMFPFLRWKWSKNNLYADLVAGLTIALVMIPQSMAYAHLAGLPVEIGLYSAFLPLIFGALFGASHFIQAGPAPTSSLLTATVLVGFAATGSSEYIALAAVLAIMVGLFRLVMGFANASILANFISKPVLDGFVNAVALIIASTQLPALLGIEMPLSNWYLRDLYKFMLNLPDFNWVTLVIGVCAIAIFTFQKKYFQRYPATLLIVIAFTAIVYFLDLAHGTRISKPIAIVGDIPKGLPSFKFTAFSWDTFVKLIPGAFMITIVGFMEVCGIAKVVAARTKRSLDINQTLIGQGAAALTAGLTGGYPVSASFRRTALCLLAGGKSGFSSIFAGLCVGLFLLFFDKTIYYLPTAALGAVVIISALRLLDFRQLFSYWRVNHTEGIASLITFVATLCFAPLLQYGVLLGVILSLIVYLFRSMKPHVCSLSLSKNGAWVDSERNSLAVNSKFPVFRFDGELFFANVSYFEEEVLKLQEKYPEAHYIAVDCHGIHSIDATGVEMIEELTNQLKENGVKLLFCEVKASVHAVFERSCTKEKLGEDLFFDWLDDAYMFVSNNEAFEPISSTE